MLTWKHRKDDSIDYDATLATGDVFRRDPKMIPPRSFQDLWPNLLWLACCLFLGDVAIRRVAPDVDRMKKLVKDGWQRLRGREVAPATEYMEKLKSRKAEVTDQLDRTRSATRFEPPPLPTPSMPLDEPLLTGELTDAAPARPAARESRPGLGPSEKPAAAESYTNRLLRAKQKVWEEREKDNKDHKNP
jgi:hypothetical protein